MANASAFVLVQAQTLFQYQRPIHPTQEKNPHVYGTGGGKSVDLMQTAASLRAELPGLDFVHLEELEREVVEGTFHTGLGAVVQAIGIKPAIAMPAG